MKYYKIPENTLYFLIQSHLFEKSCEEYFDPMEILAAHMRYWEEHGEMDELIKEYLKKYEME